MGIYVLTATGTGVDRFPSITWTFYKFVFCARARLSLINIYGPFDEIEGLFCKSAIVNTK